MNYRLPKTYRALIIGSSGAIGSGMYDAAANDANCSYVRGIHRNSDPAIDYNNLESIAVATTSLAHEEPFHLILNCTGILHQDKVTPEKKMGDLNIENMQTLMHTNAYGPILTIKHMLNLISPEGGIFATLSAKVGSIEDNRLGGWYSYRASKAALNMFIKTASIEIARTHPHLSLISIHPGTVRSDLSEPYGGARTGRPAAEAASDILNVLKNIPQGVTGEFFSYTGEKIPW